MMARAHRHRLLAAAAAGLLVLQVAALGGPYGIAHADDKDDKVREKQEIDAKIEDLRTQLTDVDQELSDTYLALARTELEIPAAQQRLTDAQDALAAAQDEDARTAQRLADAQDEEARLTGAVDAGREDVQQSDDRLAEASLAAYKGGGVPNPASVYVGSAHPQDAVDRRMNYDLTLEAQGDLLNDKRSEQALTENSADRLTAVRDEIADLKVKSAADVQAKQDAETEAADAKSSLDGLYAQQTQQKNDLETKKSQYQSDQGDLQGRSDTLDSEIQQLTQAERDRAAAGQPVATVPSAPSGSGFIRPVSGPMNSTYGWRYHPIYHYMKFHAGDDFPVGCGTPVLAAQSGTVLDTTFNSQAGNKVILSHGVKDGKVITTSYHHLEGFAVSPGQHVEQGQVVGYVGSSGSSTGCHLHFEVHEDGAPVDPAAWV